MGLADFIEQANSDDVVAPLLTNPERLHLKKNTVGEKYSTADKQSKIKPEKFSFLRPCPICQGRYFTYGKKGGFFCTTCQPGITGNPAYATGQDRPKVHTTESLETQTPVQKVSAQIRETKNETECFKIGFPWIIEHLEELLATGWTRPELFRRSRHRWCMGNWGLTWLSGWIRPGVIITIEKRGRVTFTFTSGDRTIIQAAYPLEKCKK